MVKLRNLLDDKSKIRRGRRILLNMEITFLAWFVEFVGSILFALSIFLLHESEKETSKRSSGLISGVIYSWIVPAVYLINLSDVKLAILDSKLYLKVTNMFFPHINQVAPIDNIIQGKRTANDEECNPFTKFPEYNIFDGM